MNKTPFIHIRTSKEKIVAEDPNRSRQNDRATEIEA